MECFVSNPIEPIPARPQNAESLEYSIAHGCQCNLSGETAANDCQLRSLSVVATQQFIQPAWRRSRPKLRCCGSSCLTTCFRRTIAFVGRFQKRESSREHLLLLGGQGFQRLATDAHVGFLEGLETRASRNQVPQDNVFLETDQSVDLSGQCGLR